MVKIIPKNRKICKIDESNAKNRVKFNKIIIKKAYPKDLDKIYSIILECSEWLRLKGIRQWNPPYPKDKFEKDVKYGKVYYFIDGKKLIGTATLSKAMPYYYPQEVQNPEDNIGHLTKFAVPRKLKGMGIGKKLLLEIEKHAKRNKIKKLRLDVPEFNKKLIEYYGDSGFILLDKAVLKNTPSVLMEKKIE